MLADLELRYRTISSQYARAMDLNRPDLLDQVMMPDSTIDSPEQLVRGIVEIRALPELLKKRFKLTRHVIGNQTSRPDGVFQALGETYCTAHHIYLNRANEPRNAVLQIRYQDRLQRVDGRWRFQNRKLIIDWTEVRTVTLSI